MSEIVFVVKSERSLNQGDQWLHQEEVQVLLLLRALVLPLEELQPLDVQHPRGTWIRQYHNL